MYLFEDLILDRKIRRSRIRVKALEVVEHCLVPSPVSYRDMTLDRKIWRSRIRVKGLEVVEHCLVP